MADPIKQYKVGGYAVLVFPNRVEVIKSSIFGKQTETFLLRNVTDVSSGVGKQLEITTSDGKKRRLLVAGKPAEELRAAIMDNI